MIGNTSKIRPGVNLLVRDVRKKWLLAVATSGVEGTHKDGVRVHDFPVVWVSVVTLGSGNTPRRLQEPVPWPVKDIRLADITDRRDS